MVMRIEDNRYISLLKNRVSASGGSAYKRHIEESCANKVDENGLEKTFKIHFFDDYSLNFPRVVEIDDHLLTGCLEEDIKILEHSN